MAKTCRTCNSVHYVRSCPMIGTKRRAEVWPGEEDCYYHKPRETPLLVDALGEALKNAWGGRFTDGGGDCGCERPGYTVLLTPEQCEIIQAALARYKEEVGDA